MRDLFDDGVRFPTARVRRDDDAIDDDAHAVFVDDDLGVPAYVLDRHAVADGVDVDERVV